MSKRVTMSSKYSTEEKLAYLFDERDRLQKIVSLQQEQLDTNRETINELLEVVKTLGYKIEGLNNGMHAMLRRGYQGGDC